jgi:hypothetical protein
MSVWRTRFEPLPDITPFEIAMDMKHVNASQVVMAHCCDAMGSALRHRVLDERRATRMDVIWADYVAVKSAAASMTPAVNDGQIGGAK